MDFSGAFSPDHLNISNGRFLSYAKSRPYFDCF